MNLCSVAYAMLAYALGNMILIPVNFIIVARVSGPEILLAGVVVAVSFAALREVVETINDFQLTAGSL